VSANHIKTLGGHKEIGKLNQLAMKAVFKQFVFVVSTRGKVLLTIPLKIFFYIVILYCIIFYILIFKGGWKYGGKSGKGTHADSRADRLPLLKVDWNDRQKIGHY